VALERLPPVTASRRFNKDKCLETLFGDVGEDLNQSLDMENR